MRATARRLDDGGTLEITCGNGHTTVAEPVQRFMDGSASYSSSAHYCRECDVDLDYEWPEHPPTPLADLASLLDTIGDELARHAERSDDPGLPLLRSDLRRVSASLRTRIGARG